MAQRQRIRLPMEQTLIPGSGKSLGRGNGNPLQYSCLENPMDRGAWWPAVHGITKSQTRLGAHTTTTTTKGPGTAPCTLCVRLPNSEGVAYVVPV